MGEHLAATVFISYNWGIQKTALELKVKLEENDITCWMDTAKLTGGDDLKGEVQKGIKECKVGVLYKTFVNRRLLLYCHLTHLMHVKYLAHEACLHFRKYLTTTRVPKISP